MSALLVAAFLVPLLITTAIDTHQARQQLIADMERDLAARSAQVAREIDTMNRGYQRGAGVVSRSPMVLSALSATPAEFATKVPYLNTLMEAFVLSDRAVRGVAILDAAGRVVAASEPGLLGVDLAFRHYVQQVLGGTAVIADVFVAEPQAGGTPSIAFASPVLGADRRIEGAAVVFVRASALWQALTSSGSLLGPGSGAVLMDQHGLRIGIGADNRQDSVFHPAGPLEAGTIESLVAEQRFGAKTREILSTVKAYPEGYARARAQTLDTAPFQAHSAVSGGLLYGVARRLETVGWTVFYVVTDANIQARISATLRERMIYAAACITLGLVVGGWLSKSILGRIGTLSAATAALADGNLGARVDTARRGDELAALGENFNAMATRLEGQDRELRTGRDELEIRVAVRTADLLQTTEDLNREIVARQSTESRLVAQVQRLELLGEITSAIGERQDLQSIYRAVLNRLETQLPLDFCCVCSCERGADVMTLGSVGHQGRELAKRMGLPEGAVIGIDPDGLGACLRGRLVHEPRFGPPGEAFTQSLARAGLACFVAAPLMAENEVFGMLVSARCREASFSRGECDFLGQLSKHVALAARQARLYGTLQLAYDDLRQSQQAAMQDARLRALGQMASGIAHDINNAISPISMYTELLLEQERTLTPRAHDWLTIIHRAIGDVSATVARMREFYRRAEPARVLKPLALASLIEQVVELTRARWSDMPQRRGIAVGLQVDSLPEPGPGMPRTAGVVMGVESEVREALINLVFNAVDAMPEGGTIVLRTRRLPDAVQLDVVDTGIGMDDDTRRRCLEPFFTTKGERGTGLGLAMVYGMTERHGASIDIRSEPGHGTTVSIRFPLTAAIGLAHEPPALQAPGAPAGLRLLLVDDDAVLLAALRDVLEADGHLISSAADGQAGIDAFEAAQAGEEPFDAVITDLGMPGVDGRKVAGAVKQRSPSTPVFLLTGWGQQMSIDGESPALVDCVLSKPPRLSELRQALSRHCRAVARVGQGA